jgi:hypothetical protein
MSDQTMRMKLSNLPEKYELKNKNKITWKMIV